MKDKDLVGKSVVSISDGAQIGTVKDLVFYDLVLKSLLVKGDRGEGLLPFTSISSNGPDAIMVDSYAAVDWSTGTVPDPNSRNGHDLRKLDVMDSSGNALGQVHDYSMDATGHVHQIDIRTEGVFGIGAQKTIIEGAQVCAIGPDMMTVRPISSDGPTSI